MRRAYRGRSDAMVRSAEGEQGFWPSYADMMSAVALILFFLMLLSYISNMITGNSLKTTQNELELTQQDLSDKEKISTICSAHCLSSLKRSRTLRLNWIPETGSWNRQTRVWNRPVRISVRFRRIWKPRSGI